MPDPFRARLAGRLLEPALGPVAAAAVLGELY